MNMRLKLLLIVLVPWWRGVAQPPYPAAVGASYTVGTIAAAPGQLVTLIVEGINNFGLYPAVRASAGQDLPNSLGGISVGYDPFPVPILEVHPYYGGCPANINTTCSQFTAVSVQIPFEAQCRVCSNGGVPPAFVVVSQDGVGGRRLYADTVPDQVHVLTTCDTFLNPQDYTGVGSTTGLPCPSAVTHADGSMVSAANSARPGEEIVAYAVGLGQTNPPLQTGKLVTAPVPTQTTFALDFNYHPNALGSKPLPGSPPPLFAGATPGYVGLYQINFIVPPAPPGTLPCDNLPYIYVGLNVVQSNLTVSVGGGYSFDAARICVAVP